MNFTQTARGIVRTIALVMSVAVPLAITISAADARVGGGGSSGSRGSRTYSAPPSTTTAPNAAQPMNRTFTQPGSPGMGAPAAAGAAKGGFFNRPGMMGGMLGGLAMGFLGAGLFGMLTGGGLFSGLGGISSIIGLLLQIGLIIIVVRLAMSWWQRRHTPASAYAAGPAPATGGPAEGPGAQTSFRSGMGFGLGSASPRWKSSRPTMRRSSGCLAKSRPRGRTRTSPNCIRWRRPRWCPTSPRISRRTRPATTSTR